MSTLQELREKYGMTDEDYDRLVLETAPRKSVPSTNNSPRRALSEMEEEDPLLSIFKSGGGEGSSMSDMLGWIIVMDRLDLMQERREERRKRGEPTGDMDKVIAAFEKRIEGLMEMVKEQQKDSQSNIEKLVLGKRAQEAEARADNLQAEITRRDEQETKRREQEAMLNYVDDRLDKMRSSIQTIPQEQRQGFFDEIITDLGQDLKADMKDYVLKRLKGEAPESSKPPVSFDEEGKAKVDWGAGLNRVFDLLEKYIETLRGVKERPPGLKEVKEVQTQPEFQQDTGTIENIQVHTGVEPPNNQPLQKSQQGPMNNQHRYPVPEVEIQQNEITVRPTNIVSPEPNKGIPSAELREINGIGPAREAQLKSIGVNNVAELRETDPHYVADALNIPLNIAEDWQKQAKDIQG